VERTIYLKMRNRLRVSPSYEVKIEEVAQVVGDFSIVEKIKNNLFIKSQNVSEEMGKLWFYSLHLCLGR